MYVPWTGLGLYGGFRGNRWLRNRIKVFKEFVVMSLAAQSNQDFIVWCSWRPEERNNKLVKELIEYMDSIPVKFKTVHTFSGVCFWDDKYPDAIAEQRLLTSLQGMSHELINVIGDADEVLMTIQPSDDCYADWAVQFIKDNLKYPDVDAIGFKHGYIIDYIRGEVAQYNPSTNPPFFTIKFPKDVFLEPRRHAAYTGPYKSHEYVGDKLRYKQVSLRGFLVGTHSENISTVYSHPFRGEVVDREMLKGFGIYDVPNLEIRTSIRRAILRRLPYKVQRKIRYWIGERFWQGLYEFLRG